MGLLDSIVGSVMGGGAGAGALQSILGSILNSSQGGAAGQAGGQAGGLGGLGGLVQQMNQAGLGSVVNSWIGNGPNQSVDPQALGRVFHPDQLNQWSQQTGMSQDSILGSLSKLLPHAVDQATPNGQMPTGASPFDGAGMELPR